MPPDKGHRTIGRTEYDATSIDWDRLKRYAARVARETPLDPTASLSYTGNVAETVMIERRVGGFLGIGARTERVSHTQYAKKTVTVLREHWVLSYTDSHTILKMVSKAETFEDQNHHWYTHALLPDGSLVYVVVHERETITYGRADGHGPNYNQEIEHTLDEIRDGQVAWMDYASRYVDTTRRLGPGRTEQTWGHGFQGKLLRHAKGVGLNLALKQILEGRQPQP